MRVLLAIEVDVSEEGLRRYHAQYPAFQAEFDESVQDTLFREAVAAWDFEDLLTPGVEPRLLDALATEAAS